MAVGTLELALWDAAAKLEGRPLYQVLASRYGVAGAGRPRAIACYAGGGFYKPTDDRARLRDEIQGYLDAGYRDVKIKAGGLPLAQDLARIESALALLHDGSHLALDASCAFGRDSALAYARAVAPYGCAGWKNPATRPISTPTAPSANSIRHARRRREPVFQGRGGELPALWPGAAPGGAATRSAAGLRHWRIPPHGARPGATACRRPISCRMAAT